MIISPEVFYNVAALLHIAMLVLVVVFIVGQVVIFVAKYRAVRSLKRKFERDMEGFEEMLEDLPAMLKEMHAHVEKHEAAPVAVVKRKRPAAKKAVKKVIKKNK